MSSPDEPPRPQPTRQRSSLLSRGASALLRRSINAAEHSSDPPARSEQVAIPPPQATGEGDGLFAAALGRIRRSLGIYGVELWHFEEATGDLVPVSLSDDVEKGSFDIYLKRQTQEADQDNDYSTEEACESYARISDNGHPDFLPPARCAPGVGLPGVLWAESSGHGHDRGDALRWREVVPLSEDPDQPHDERLLALAKAGFKLAAGVPFDCHGYRGLCVVYGNPHGDPRDLNDPRNVRFIKRSAALLGVAAALRVPTEEVAEFRKEVSYGNWHRLKIKLLTVIWFGGAAKKLGGGDGKEGPGGRPKMERKSSVQMMREASAQVKENARKAAVDARDAAVAKGARWARKLQGGNAGIPPAFTWSNCLVTFFGVFITHLMLSKMNAFIVEESAGELSLILAPLGALTTLQYNLTAAPASQPRNAIFGQLFGVTVAIALSYIPFGPNLAWLRSVLAPAIVIPGMAKLGITHPPAGAAAIVFCSGKFMWEHFGIFFSGVALSVINAVIINNASDKRQYPTSWPLMKKAKETIIKE